MNLEVVTTGAVLQFLSILYCTSLTAHGGTNLFSEIVQEQQSVQRLDHCFCELKGQVDECCCDVETVDVLNENHIYPTILALLNRTFFRFFQVNLHRKCPFWPDDGRCVLKGCHVEECSEDSLPAYLRESEEESSCDMISEEEKELSIINNTISVEQRQEFSNWQDFDSTNDNFCEMDAESANGNGELSYVDLHLNPERFTGYSGHSAQRIWKAIYHENCFRPNRQVHSSLSLFDSSVLQNMCLEKRTFYRIISGLHSSINIHLSSQYLITGGRRAKFGPNLNEFVRRFDSVTTNGQGPSWLKNLYFGYLVVLRAVVKMENHWKDYDFYTGNSREDRETRLYVSRVVTAAKSCSSSLFDESMLFNGKTSASLKNEFKLHFQNISVIMDCVGCDKCKLWGRLQVQGIGTALKILFADRRNGPPLYLSRMELVALFNVLGRFSSSIHSLSVFKDAQNRDKIEL